MPGLVYGIRRGNGMSGMYGKKDEFLVFFGYMSGIGLGPVVLTGQSFGKG